jgi:hypothetical protein
MGDSAIDQDIAEAIEKSSFFAIRTPGTEQLADSITPRYFAASVKSSNPSSFVHNLAVLGEEIKFSGDCVTDAPN